MNFEPLLLIMHFRNSWCEINAPGKLIVYVDVAYRSFAVHSLKRKQYHSGNIQQRQNKWKVRSSQFGKCCKKVDFVFGKALSPIMALV